MTLPFGISLQAGVFILTVLLTIIAGLVMLPLLKKIKFGQTIRDDGPLSHLVKEGTPTAGGIIFLIPLMLAGILFGSFYPKILPLVLVTLLFGIVGFADDMIKIKRHSKNGLTAAQKMSLLLLISVLYTVYETFILGSGTDMIIPFAGIDQTVTLPVWLYVPLIIFVFISTTNAVNLTDGVDGLASGVTLTVFVFMTIVAMTVAEWTGIVVFSAAMAGCCLGFLAFNLHPAKMFMGDTGSLALGGAVAAVAIAMKMPWIILIAGFIYVAEALSVVLQVVSFKSTGRRIFKMTPIHHHFELSGWKENAIVAVFVFVTVVLAIAGLAVLRINVF